MNLGVGPVCCPSCMIFVDTEHSNDYKQWRCNSCGTDVLEYLWLFTDVEQRTIAQNSRFIRFVQGQDEQPTTT